jgi:hypothetical protein
MPLNVKVELEHGRTGEKRTLAELRIENIGGAEECGDYRVYEVGNPDAVPGSGRVRGHDRLTEPVWALVVKALKSVGYEAK